MSKSRGKSPQPPVRNGSSKSKGTSYKSDGVNDNDVFLLPSSDYLVALGITVLSAAVRIFRIYQPTSVVFDEVHFGGFASKYIKGKFFMDVHPPLAKMLIALTGWLAGFDGEFDFKDIGKDYLEPGVPYVAMRMYPAICGILLAPFMFFTLKTLGCRTMTSAMGAGLIIFENGLLTQARLILLDSPLVCATAFTALSFSAFTNQQEQGPSKAFQPSWWFWLAMTGLGLGITSSIKWVGLFTIAWVGALTVVQLWILLGDYQNVTPRLWCKHLMARVFCLIMIPATFYMAMFAIHFVCLVNPGEGDGFMSSEFQATLNHKGMHDVPADVMLGSRVSIRHVNTQGGYLHSHPLMYPTGSQQQQMTLYPHKDDNNVWVVENETQPLGPDGEPINGTFAWDNLPPQYLEDGMMIRLLHLQTGRRVHSHDVRPPITEADWQNEVSAYGYEGFEGDANDFFRVEIVKKKSDGEIAKKRVRTIQTQFKLVHAMTGCNLFSHKVKLPDWASEQQEVTCARGGSLPNSLWYIEHNEHPQLGEGVEKVNYRNPGFFGKFIELHQVMWRTNAGLTDSHAWDSRPDSWPILRRGINFWGKHHRQIYLIGNPVIWWASTAAVVVWIAFKALAVVRWQRSFDDYSNTLFKRFDYEVGTAVLGWGLHYFPFYLMQRQLFLHHYFPALYFAIIAFCLVFDYATARLPFIGIHKNPIINRAATMLFLVVSIAAFTLLAPLAYGNTWTKSECNRVKLFTNWDWDCNTFYDSYNDYNIIEPPSPSSGLPIGENAVKAGQEGAEAVVSGGPDLSDAKVLSSEHKIEYRDENGRLLNDEEVEALKGKVEFRTKYETKTRLVDEHGVEMPVAPPHPDVEGDHKETIHAEDSSRVNKQASSSRDGEREAEGVQARPASEGKEATRKDEL